MGGTNLRWRRFQSRRSQWSPMPQRILMPLGMPWEMTVRLQRRLCREESFEGPLVYTENRVAAFKAPQMVKYNNAEAIKPTDKMPAEVVSTCRWMLY